MFVVPVYTCTYTVNQWFLRPAIVTHAMPYAFASDVVRSYKTTVHNICTPQYMYNNNYVHIITETMLRAAFLDGIGSLGFNLKTLGAKCFD